MMIRDKKSRRKKIQQTAQKYGTTDKKEFDAKVDQQKITAKRRDGSWSRQEFASTKKDRNKVIPLLRL